MAEPKSPQRYRANLQGEVDSAALYGLCRDRNQSTAGQGLSPASCGRRSPCRVLEEPDRGARPTRPRCGRVSHPRAGLAGAPLWPVLRAADDQHARADRQRLVRHAAGGGRRRAPAAERSHARIIEAWPRPRRRASGPTLARLEGRHRGIGGNALRAAVLGANDGLVSNLSLVMGVAGAGCRPRTILITGLAGLVAGACSMAMGEWLSVNSSRELYQSQIATEADELEQVPEEEKEELALIYQAKGLREAQARALAEQLIGQQGHRARHAGARGARHRSRRARRLGLGRRGHVVPAVRRRRDLSGDAVFLARRLAGAARQPARAASRCCDRRRDLLFTGRGDAFSGCASSSSALAAAGVTFGIGHLIGVAIGG